VAEPFGLASFAWRFLLALVLVFCTYNPTYTDYSFVHWVISVIKEPEKQVTPEMALAAVTLLIGWVIYLKATFDAMGLLGVTLGLAFFGCLVWMLIDRNIISTDSPNALIYIVQVLLAAILALGMSWAHLRRRWTGQQVVDDVDDE
jgi:hypothetical protein